MLKICQAARLVLLLQLLYWIFRAGLKLIKLSSDLCHHLISEKRIATIFFLRFRLCGTGISCIWSIKRKIATRQIPKTRLIHGKS